MCHAPFVHTSGVPQSSDWHSDLDSDVASDWDDTRSERASPSAADDVQADSKTGRIRADVTALRQQVKCIQEQTERMLELLLQRPHAAARPARPMPTVPNGHVVWLANREEDTKPERTVCATFAGFPRIFLALFL